MNLLLDTHVALWAITDSPRLSGRARDLILAPRSTVWISAATTWEISIKHGLGRGDMPVSGEEALGYFRQAGFACCPSSLSMRQPSRACPPITPTPSTGCSWRRPSWSRCAC